MMNDKIPSVAEVLGLEVGESSILEELPCLLDSESYETLISVYPEYKESERRLPKSSRIALLNTIETFFQTMEHHYEVIDTIYTCLVAGYQYREQMGVTRGKGRVQWLRRRTDDEFSIGTEVNRPLEGPESAPFGSPMACLLGISGLGKSRTIKRALEFLPVKIVLPDGTLHFPCIYVQCAHDGQLKGTLKSVFRAIHKAGGPDYLSLMGSNPTVERLKDKLIKVIGIHLIGIIVIDEIQNGLVQKGIHQLAVVNCFVELNNTAQVPIFFVGTPSMKSMVADTVYGLRRAGKNGAIFWEPCDLNGNWENFISALWIYQWTSKYTKFTGELSYLMHDLSQGIFGIAVSLFILTQRRAIENDIDRITPDLLREIAEEKLFMVAPALQALRTNDTVAMAKYTDLLDQGQTGLHKSSRSTPDIPDAGEEYRAKCHSKAQYEDAKLFIEKNLNSDKQAIIDLQTIYTQDPNLRSSTLVHKVHKLMLARQKRAREGRSSDATQGSRTWHGPRGQRS
ncbi:ATP-binding protein [Cupriavidus numazuensis]|uniref:ORC1/DEAH AAA+ ATPase domain-containing protein n=1 Tax=Cupriavidus numazuensis TaxID=221992 RepID=A0ABM8TSB0_9BURK|nr:ATP-binding protein [Cupriavidus numazuensis]CAG2159211.1 hypothetical protein LMG26411_06524 [Cupriavidus numazuensis]